MGAWGYGSFDNDTALDFLPNLFSKKALTKIAGWADKKSINSWEYDEARITASIVIHLHKINNLWFDRPVIDGLIVCLRTAVSDQNWIDSWVDATEGQKLVKKIRSDINKLKKLETY